MTDKKQKTDKPQTKKPLTKEKPVPVPSEQELLEIPLPEREDAIVPLRKIEDGIKKPGETQSTGPRKVPEEKTSEE